MTAGLSRTADAPTLEEIVDRLVEELRSEGALPKGARGAPWDAFLRLSNRVHETFEVPATSVTPAMRRLLFAVGYAARPRTILAVGTYVGYALAWLLRDASDPEAGPFCSYALAVDVDESANSIARKNCAVLGHGARLEVVTANARRSVAAVSRSIDLLYLDLDEPASGKAGYSSVLALALPALSPGALVLAHDPSVPRFASDFESYHATVAGSPRLRGPWVLPIDPCGLSVARVPPDQGDEDPA